MRAGLLIVPAVDAWRQPTKALDPRIAAPDSNSFAVSQRLSIDSSRTTVKFSAAPRRSEEKNEPAMPASGTTWEISASDRGQTGLTEGKNLTSRSRIGEGP